MNWKVMKETWPSCVVARKSIDEFTGGAISRSTMSNHDSQGTGPKIKQRLGGTVVYPIDSLIEWLETNPMMRKKKKGA